MTENNLPQLCRLCKQISPVSNTTILYESRHIRDSANRGCCICLVLWRDFGSDIYGEASLVQENIELVCQKGALEVKGNSHYREWNRKYEVYSLHGGEETHRLRPMYTPLISESSRERVQNWISTCKSTHPQCKVQVSMMPDWLIDVTGMPAIVNTEKFNPRGPYVVLSHDVKDTETDTLQSLVDFKKLPQPVPWNALPGVFQDAIMATLELGIKYLWIAELCIGPQDLQYGISMGRAEARFEAHDHAFLTLSALDNIIMDWQQDERRVPLATFGNLCLRSAPRGFKREIRESAVVMSAQCLQEHLVATRMIHFGRDELYWECNAVFAREGSNEERTITSEDMCTVEENFKATVLFDQDGDPIPNALKKWYQFIQRYSTLETKSDECSENPLLNIMGIIYSFNHVLGHIVVGHCEKDLHYGLLWYQNPTEDCKSYSKMPSWSWASRRGPISMLPSAESMTYTGPDAIQAKVVDFFSVLGSSDNVCSSLVDAKLVLEGYSLHVRCDPIVSAHRDGVRKSGWDHSVPVQIFENGGELIGTGYLDSVVEASPFSQAESVSRSAGWSANLVALAICQRVDPAMGGTPITYFLLIATDPEGGGSVWRRAGVGCTMDPAAGSIEKTDAFELGAEIMFDMS